MKTKWIFAPYAFEGRVGGNIHEVAISMGYDVDICDFNEYTKKYYPPSNYEDRPVILYGSHQFVRRNYHRYYPGAFGLNNVSVNEYMANMPIDWFMNSDGFILSWGMFKGKFNQIQDILSSKSLFIRPVSGNKSFTGLVITDENFTIECLTIEQISRIEPHELIYIAACKQFGTEYRYVIIDGNVIASSDYNWDNFNDIRGISDPICDQLANKVASHDWQPDIAYTVDITLHDNHPKIIEFNSFSCAGFYGCDLKSILHFATKAAEKRYKEEFDL